jgi:ribosomal protein L7Ae-like RNA K-turn-binding protein
MSEPISYLRIGRKAGLLETGEENCGAAIRGGKAKLLVIAADASDNAVRRAEGFLRGRQTPMIISPITKLEIAEATGRNGCSMFVFTDIGLASSFASALAEADPEKYSAVGEQLSQKRKKAMQRKEEAHNHEKNKKKGKRRTSE